jgi:hypothetical protein
MVVLVINECIRNILYFLRAVGLTKYLSSSSQRERKKRLHFQRAIKYFRKSREACLTVQY